MDKELQPSTQSLNDSWELTAIHAINMISSIIRDQNKYFESVKHGFYKQNSKSLLFSVCILKTHP